MGKSIIILGRGYSVTKCTKEFVDLHDEVCIVNRVIYVNYEHLVSNHADYLFTNKTGLIYNPNLTKELGIKEMLFTGKPNQRFEKTNPLVKSTYPNPNLSIEMFEKYGFDVSSGMQALFYFIKNENHDKITIVGFDFYEIGSIPYYFKVEEAHQRQKYLWGSTYKGNKINIHSGHDTDKSIQLFEQLILENLNIEFNVISNSKRINEIKTPNFKIPNLDE